MKIWGIHDNADGKGAPSGCGWFRVIMPLAELGRNGHDTGWKCGRPLNAREYDVIVGQRFDNPDVLKEWRRFRMHSRLAYEIDDDIWSIPPANRMAHTTYKWEFHRDAVETAAAVADVVTVTTEPLAEILRKFNPEVRIVPNQIPAALLDWQKPEHDGVVVGWRGGGSHALDVQVIAPAVRKVIRAHPHASLHVVGTDFRPSFGVRGARYTDWVPVDASMRYYHSIEGFDINLAPLSGLEFDRSKSNINALEAGAMGTPTIATDSEPYRDFVEDGVTGYLIRHRSDWPKRLRELVNDADARAEMGANARKRAEAWTIESGYRRWEAVYEELTG